MLTHQFVDDMGNLINAGHGSVDLLAQYLFQSKSAFADLVADLMSVRPA